MGYEKPDGGYFMVVEDLDLDFSISARYALLGESGAGKTTLLAMSRFGNLLPVNSV